MFEHLGEITKQSELNEAYSYLSEISQKLQEIARTFQVELQKRFSGYRVRVFICGCPDDRSKWGVQIHENEITLPNSLYGWHSRIYVSELVDVDEIEILLREEINKFEETKVAAL